MIHCFRNAPLKRAAALLLLFLSALWLGLRFSPYPELQTFLDRPYSIRFYDRNGVLAQIPSLGEGLRREFLSLEEIPEEVKAVFILAEDRRFYAHPGIDPLAIARAFFQNLRSGRRVSGASTITMQLARIIGNYQGDSCDNIRGNGRSNNRGGSRDNNQGNSQSGGRDNGQSSSRANSPNNNQSGNRSGDPANSQGDSQDNNLGSSRNNNQSNNRAGSLIRKLAEALNALRLEARLSKDEILELYLNSAPFGFQTEGAASSARTFFAMDLSMLSPAQIFCLAVIPRRPGFYNPLDSPENSLAAARELQSRFRGDKKLAAAWPHLAAVATPDWDYALHSARRFDYPFELPHLIRHVAAALKERPRLVRHAAAVLEERPPQTAPRKRRSQPALPTELRLSADLDLQRRLEGLIAGNVSRHYASRLTNGAAIVIDNATGEILAWVGSADYRDAGAAGQIDGVLTLNQPGSSMKPFLYALALESGFSPAAVVPDIPMNFGSRELYIPQNFNNRFNGPMLFRSALASSLNIPAVHLLYRLGVRSYAEKLLSLGFDSLAAVPGAEPESAAEQAGLGLALGNAPVSLAELVRAFSVFPRDGLLVPLSWEASSGGQPPAERVFSADTARLICSFLSDSGARTLAFGTARNFRAPFPAIFKTGTANQYQSIVALGATPRFSAAVWMGNFTGETVVGKTGSSLPAAIVRDTLSFLQGNDAPDFPAPEHFALHRICALSGMAATPSCPSVMEEYAAAGLPPCDWHRGSTVAYPAEYQAWFASSSRQGELDHHSRPLELLQPREGFVFYRSPGIGRDEIPVEATGGAADLLEVSYDGETFQVSRPFMFYLPALPGAHTLRVRNGSEGAEIHFVVR
jgi:penicillin-binding protein 1C